MIAAAKLQYRVRIERRPAARDAAGQPIEVTDWPEVATVWADIRLLGGLETIKAGAVTEKVRASIRIRTRAGLNSGMRVVHGAKVYQIETVLPDLADRRHIDLVCEVFA